jgi:predicted O-methyltransferase YrrM
LLSADAPFDGVFIDANKEQYPAFLDWAIEHTRPGGIILGHNAFMNGAIVAPNRQAESWVQGMRLFNERLASDPRLLSTIIPIGDGIAAALKIG